MMDFLGTAWDSAVQTGKDVADATGLTSFNTSDLEAKLQELTNEFSRVSADETMDETERDMALSDLQDEIDAVEAELADAQAKSDREQGPSKGGQQFKGKMGGGKGSSAPIASGGGISAGQFDADALSKAAVSMPGLSGTLGTSPSAQRKLIKAQSGALGGFKL